MRGLNPYEFWRKQLGIQAKFLFHGQDAHQSSLRLVSERVFQKQVQKNQITKLRPQSPSHPLLVEFNTLPNTWQSLSLRVFGDPEQVIRESENEFILNYLNGREISTIPEYEREQEQKQEHYQEHPPVNGIITINTQAQQWYEQFKYSLNGIQTHLNEKLRREYTANASVLGEAIKWWNTGDKRTALALIEASRETLHHTLPRSTERLEDKIRQYQTDGFEALISAKVGNQNTLKINAEASQQIIALKRSRTPVYTDLQILDKFNSIAAERGWEHLKSVRSLKQFLNQSHIEPLWYDAVHGELKAHQRYARRHRTELPSLRDALWYGDGTKLNLYYRDESGKMRTTLVYEVMDAYSETLLGYFISDTEDYEAQYHAYRMAIQTAEHKPYEIVYDNQGGHKRNAAGGLFARICHMHRPTAPHSGQSKSIESVFGRFQADILHQDWRFTGQNITAKKVISRPNLEFIEANKDKLYSLKELKEAYSKARQTWNQASHPATGIPRIEMYRRSRNSETQHVTALDMVEMFWITTKQASTFTSQGIEIEIKGEKYRYEVFAAPGVPDHEWRRANTLQRFYVMYDPYDMTSVRLYRKDKAGELRFERVAEPYLVIHRAIQEQAEDEMAIIRREQIANQNDRIERQVAARKIEIEHGVAPEQNGLSTPELKGISKQAQAEIDSRTGISGLERQNRRREKIYSQEPESSKTISFMTFDELEKHAAGKL
jgi:hypothetical protein